MAALVQYRVSGVLLGAIYALIALGIVVYESTRAFDFAQAQLIVWGALLLLDQWYELPKKNTADREAGGDLRRRDRRDAAGLGSERVAVGLGKA